MNDSTYSTLLGMASSAILGGVSFILRRFVNRIESTEKRLRRFERILRTLVEDKFPAHKVASIYRDDFPEDET